MENHSDIQLQYFTHLVDSETARIRELMAPFLEFQDRENTEMLEQLTRVMGEFGARVNVIEQAAEQQLFVENPLKAGPMLHGNFIISAEELDSGSFHAAETIGEGRVTRWTKRPEFTVHLPVYRPCVKTLSIYFNAIIKTEYIKASQIFVDQKELSHRVKKSRGELCLQCRLPPAEDLALTGVILKLPAVHTPSDLGISGDRRELGIAINRITVNDSSSSIFDRVFSR